MILAGIHFRISAFFVLLKGVSIMNAEQKKMYLTETTLALNCEGFHAEILHGGKLGVWLDDKPLCEISDGGAVHYHSSDIPSPERIEARTELIKSLAPSSSICA